MGQIRGKKAHIDACNIRSLSSFGIPAAGQHILVSTDNSATADGQGNFDCYIVGDGHTAATALPLKRSYVNDVNDNPINGSMKLVTDDGLIRYVGANVNSYDGAILKMRHQVDITTESTTGNRYAVIFYVNKGDEVFVQSSYAAGICAAIYNTIERAIYLGRDYIQIFGNYGYSSGDKQGIVEQNGYLSVTFKKSNNTAISDAEISEFLNSLTITIKSGLYTEIEKLKESNKDVNNVDNKNTLYLGKLVQQAYNATGLVDREDLRRVTMADAIALPFVGCAIKFHLPKDVMVGFRHGGRGANLGTNSYWFYDGQTFTFPTSSLFYRISFGNGIYGERENISLTDVENYIASGKIKIEILKNEDSSIVSRNSQQERILKAYMLNETNYRAGNLLKTHPIIVHASDVHGDYYRMRNIYDYARSIDADVIIVTGDICSYQPSDGQKYLEYLDDEFNIPTIVCTGNHDTSYITSDEQIYNQVVKHFAEKYNIGTTKPYYYQDVDSIEIRFISLNIYDGGHTGTQEYCNIFKTQMEWFISTLASTPAGYGVVVLMHSPEEEIVAAGSDSSFISPSVEYPHYHDGMSGTPLKDIIEAFRTKTSGTTEYKNYSESNNTVVSYDFSQVNSGVYFIAFASGHQHEDLCGYNIGTTQPHLNNTCSIGCYGLPAYPYYSNLSDLPRGTNGVTQDCFNVYIIDKENRSIRITKIGSTLKTDFSERSHTIISY